MPFIGHIHPLLVHFPIALLLAAAGAELLVIAAPHPVWRSVAVVNACAGAVIGVVTVVTGWLFASSPMVAATTTLEWHRWLGTASVASAIAATLLWRRHVSAQRSAATYRVALFVTALLVAVTGHLGGTLVWGARFFRP